MVVAVNVVGGGGDLVSRWVVVLAPSWTGKEGGNSLVRKVR